MLSLTDTWKLPLSTDSWLTVPMSGERVPTGVEALSMLIPPAPALFEKSASTFQVS